MALSLKSAALIGLPTVAIGSVLVGALAWNPGRQPLPERNTRTVQPVIARFDPRAAKPAETPGVAPPAIEQADEVVVIVDERRVDYVMPALAWPGTERQPREQKVLYFGNVPAKDRTFEKGDPAAEERARRGTLITSAVQWLIEA